MATNVTHTDHAGGTDTERTLGGYTWNKANNWTVEMLDSHAQILQQTPEASEFKFVPVDPNAAKESGQQARTDFGKLKPGKETAAPAPTSTNVADTNPTLYQQPEEEAANA